MEAANLRPGDIASARFSIGKRGYEPEEVDEFLQAVADHLGRLQGEIEWQRARVEHLEQRTVAAQESAYDRISREFMEVVRRADEAASQVRTKAEDEARAALSSAREESNRMMAAGAEEAERVLLTARAEAERLVAEATRQVERLVREAGGRAAPRRQEQPASARLAQPHQDRESARRRHPAGRGQEPAVPRAHIPPPGNGHAAPVRREPAPVIEDIPEPAFADFEELNLEFEGSLFDLLGDPGA
jgi:DivIVA domain-containing protein